MPVEIRVIHLPAQARLFQVVVAGGFQRLDFGFAQRGQQHRRQDRDDGDHHQQLDQGKSSRGFVSFHMGAL